MFVSTKETFSGWSRHEKISWLDAEMRLNVSRHNSQFLEKTMLLVFDEFHLLKRCFIIQILRTSAPGIADSVFEKEITPIKEKALSSFLLSF